MVVAIGLVDRRSFEGSRSGESANWTDTDSHCWVARSAVALGRSALAVVGRKVQHIGMSWSRMSDGTSSWALVAQAELEVAVVRSRADYSIPDPAKTGDAQSRMEYQDPHRGHCHGRLHVRCHAHCYC